MVNIVGYWLVDSVDHFNAESSKLRFNILNNIFRI